MNTTVVFLWLQAFFTNVYQKSFIVNVRVGSKYTYDPLQSDNLIMVQFKYQILENENKEGKDARKNKQRKGNS